MPLTACIRGVSVSKARSCSRQVFQRGQSSKTRRIVCKSVPDGESTDGESVTMPIVDDEADWREFRAQLVSMNNRGAVPGASTSASQSSWAHVLPGPEHGCVLVANPLMFTHTQTYFDQAVILVFEHSKDYSAGIILNKPSDVLLRDLNLKESLAAFGGNRLYLGGDVCEASMQLMHGRDVPGAMSVRRGVFIGGADAVCELVRRGDMQPEEVKWYTRYAGWGAGQLASECRRNVWFPVSCSEDLLLQEVDGDGRHVWHAVMELLGDDYKNVSDQVKEMRKTKRRAHDEGL